MLVKTSTQTLAEEYPIDLNHPQPYTDAYCKSIYEKVVRWMMQECTYDPERTIQSCKLHFPCCEISFYFYTEFDAFEISLSNAPEYSVPSYPKKPLYQGNLLTFGLIDKCDYKFPPKATEDIWFLRFIIAKKR